MHTDTLLVHTPTSEKIISSTIDKEYVGLKRQVRQAHLLEKQTQTAIFRLFIITVALLAGLIALFALRNTWIQLIDAVYLAVVLAQVGFLGHDAGHRQLFATTRNNEWAGLFLGNLLIGMSNGWWIGKHNQHHSHPNQVDMDPDLNIPGICFNVDDALQKRGFERLIMRYQAWLFFPMLLLVAIDMGRVSLIFLVQEWKSIKYPLLEILLMLIHWVVFPLLLICWLGWGPALLFMLVNQGLLGFILGSAFAPNHKGMPVLEKDCQLGFLRRQVLTARNIRSGSFTDFWYGGLNYQIEHHLFPAMPRKNLRAAQKLVRHYCQEYEISYTETTILGSYTAILAVLSDVSTHVRQQERTSGR